MQRRAAFSCGNDQVIKNLNWNGIGVGGVLQSGLKASGACEKYSAFNVPLIVRSECVIERLVALKQSFPGGFAHLAISRVQECPVATVGELNLIS